jgi:hypothetical protein
VGKNTEEASMRKMVMAAALAALPLTLALAQPGAPGAPGGGAGPDQKFSLYGQGGAPAKVVVTTPKLNLMPTLEYMRQVINPAANAYWAQEGALDDNDITKVLRAPANDDEWKDQVARAAVLMEAGNGLFTAGRPRNGACRDDGAAPQAGAAAPAPAQPGAPARGGGRAPAASCEAVWTYYAQQLIDGGAEALAASRAKNAKAAFDAGSKMYDACYSCHARYIPRPAVSRYTAPFPSDEEVLAKMKARADAEAKAKAEGKAP